MTQVGEVSWEFADDGDREALLRLIRRESLSAPLKICRSCGSVFPQHRCDATAVRR